jgi:putative redox protein
MRRSAAREVGKYRRGSLPSGLRMTETPEADFSLDLTWQGGQRFDGVSGGVSISIDGTRATGPSPVQTVAFALASCMAIDVVDVIEKGRLPLRAVSCHLEVFRASETPKKITGLKLHFQVTGDVPPDRIARAIELSRDRYCSVWHSLDPSIDFKTSFAVNP